MENKMIKIRNVHVVSDSIYGATFILYPENSENKAVLIVMDRLNNDKPIHFRYGFEISNNDLDLYNIHDQIFPYTKSELIKLPGYVQINLIEAYTSKFILQICTELGYHLNKDIRLDSCLLEFAIKVSNFNNSCDDSDNDINKPMLCQILNIYNDEEYIKIYKRDKDKKFQLIIGGKTSKVYGTINPLILEMEVDEISVDDNILYIIVDDHYNLINTDLIKINE